MRLGILRERKSPPDFRVPLSPNQAASLKQNHPETDLVVESYPERAFSDRKYQDAGLEIRQEMEDCDVLLGVKEVPIETLIPHKTYFFFSHTIKKQPYNLNLLKAVLAKNIRLIDYECLRDEQGMRTIGFGRYAGVVGAYHSLRAWALRQGNQDLPAPQDVAGRYAMDKLLKSFNPGNLKVLLTGEGRVANGAREVLTTAGFKEASLLDFERIEGPAFLNVDFTRYNVRSTDGGFDLQEFFKHPDRYTSGLLPYLKPAHMLITGHYWAEGSPNLFQHEQIKNDLPLLQVVGDISCDIDGPIPVTLRPSTLEDPYYGVSKTEKRILDKAFDPQGITVMAVDNLPCAMPQDASEDFGSELLPILDAFLQNPEAETFKKATIAQEGSLGKYYDYLADWVAGKE